MPPSHSTLPDQSDMLSCLTDKFKSICDFCSHHVEWHWIYQLIENRPTHIHKTIWSIKRSLHLYKKKALQSKQQAKNSQTQFHFTAVLLCLRADLYYQSHWLFKRGECSWMQARYKLHTGSTRTHGFRLKILTMKKYMPIQTRPANC